MSAAPARGPRPPAALTAEDLIDLNRRVLIETAFEGDRPHGVQNAPGLARSVAIAGRHFHAEPHRRATLLCCAIIANHPFNDGNHRTSLEAATLQLLMDGWFYSADEDAEKTIYNWRFDYEEAHGLEPEWSRTFGGWDVGAEEHSLLVLVESEYGREIERFLRRHTEAVPIDSILLWLPPSAFARHLKSFPAGPWKKEIRRKRRALSSQLRPTWRRMQTLLDKEPARVPRPQKHWRPEKL